MTRDRVKANKGSPGVDGISVHELPGYLKQHWGVSIERTTEELARYLRGWLGHAGQMARLDEALQRILRFLLGMPRKNDYSILVGILVGSVKN
jgi:hypothetical protein